MQQKLNANESSRFLKYFKATLTWMKNEKYSNTDIFQASTLKTKAPFQYRVYTFAAIPIIRQKQSHPLCMNSRFLRPRVQKLTDAGLFVESPTPFCWLHFPVHCEAAASQNRIVILFLRGGWHFFARPPRICLSSCFLLLFLGSPSKRSFLLLFSGKMQISWHPRDGPQKQPPKKAQKLPAELAPARLSHRNPGPKPNTLQGPRPQDPQKPHKRKRIAFMILRRLCTLQDYHAQVYWTQPQLLLYFYQPLPSSIDWVAQKVG